MKNKFITLSVAAIALLGFSVGSFLQADDKGTAKCEKCYRGPDGKMKCDPVPCPGK